MGTTRELHLEMGPVCVSMLQAGACFLFRLIYAGEALLLLQLLGDTLLLRGDFLLQIFLQSWDTPSL